MKSLFVFYMAGFVLVTIASSVQSQNFYAEVNGDTVTLWETQAWRNCGSMYVAEVEEVGYTINWYQIDTGMTATCYCIFDLSLTYGPLEPGDYTANIYYTDAWSPTDTIYEGSVDFTIVAVGRSVTDGGIISNYQSDCYSGQGIEEAKEDEIFRIYPVPVRPGQIFHLESEFINENAVLEIFTISGQKIFSKEYKGKMSVSDQWFVEDLFPVPGIYNIRLSTSKSITTKLVAVL